MSHKHSEAIITIRTDFRAQIYPQQNLPQMYRMPLTSSHIHLVHYDNISNASLRFSRLWNIGCMEAVGANDSAAVRKTHLSASTPVSIL